MRFWGANLGSVPQQFPNPVRIDIKADVVTLVQFQIEARTRQRFVSRHLHRRLLLSGSACRRPERSRGREVGHDRVLVQCRPGVAHRDWRSLGRLQARSGWAAISIGRQIGSGTFPYRCSFARNSNDRDAADHFVNAQSRDTMQRMSFVPRAWRCHARADARCVQCREPISRHARRLHSRRAIRLGPTPEGS